MEGYQTATVVVGIISTALWFIVGFLAPIFFLPGIVAFAFLFTCFVDTKHHTTIGAIYLVVGILFNWLYLIPAIMALRWKHPSEVVKPVPAVNVYTVDPKGTADEIAELKERLAELKNKKDTTIGQV